MKQLLKVKNTGNKAIAHTINRDGKIVQANGFKQSEPSEITLINHSPIWMHSIDRTDVADPKQGFIILGIMVLAAVAVLIFVR